MRGDEGEGREADLHLGPFRLWAKGRPFPDAQNGWDEAFIETYLIVEVPSAWVEQGSGDGFTSMELAAFIADLQALDATLVGQARLVGESHLLSLAGDGLGHCQVEITVPYGTPSHQHRFSFDVDQTDVRELLRQSRALLKRYPVPTRYAR